MGSLAPQGTGNDVGVTLTSDEAISVDTSYANGLIINSRDVKDSVITLYNDDVTATLSYKIYASAKFSLTVPADSDTSWVNIIDTELEDPASYDHDLERTIPARGVFYESFSNKWGWVRVEMKSSSGTITAKAWHRGTS